MLGYVVRETNRGRCLDIMSWDVLGGGAAWLMTNVRNLGLSQWRSLTAKLENRCLIALSEFCEWTPEAHNLGDGKNAKGRDVFPGDQLAAVSGRGLLASHRQWKWLHEMTCDPNELVAPIHPKAMITVLEPADHERWLRGSYEDVVVLQQPYPAERMAVRGPVFPTLAAKLLGRSSNV